VLRWPPARCAVDGIIVQIVTSPTEGAEVTGERLASVLATALGGATRVAVVGEDRGLPRASQGLFVSSEGLPRSDLDGCEILATDSETATLERSADLARTAGRNRLFVLVESEDGASEALRAAGLGVSSADRLLFRAPDGSPVGARAERLDAETEAVLLTCLLMDDPASVARLEEEVARLRAELEVRAQLEVDHAATREAERARAARLLELEETLARVPNIDLFPEVERLRAEIAEMRATRVWRLGSAWWRLRDRILRR
jgi:hypothetical protein